MSDLSRIVESIAGRLESASTDGGISPKDIPSIVGGSIGEIGGSIGESHFNCYPGLPGNTCHYLAVFVSLTSPQHKGKHRGHLSCLQAIEKLIQHMQGICANDETHAALLVVDSWDSGIVSAWRPNLREIQSSFPLEIYLLDGGIVTRLKV